MRRIHKTQVRAVLLVSAAMLFVLTFLPEQIYAQEPWPPFWFEIIPSYESGKITYNIEFSSRVEWQMSDLVIKVLLPENTRFLEAETLLPNRVEFNGQEVIFFIQSFDYQSTEGNSFTVEITNPTQTVFTTQSTITWNGDQPGSYQTEIIPFDTTWQPLNWEPLPQSRLQLGAKATTDNNIITYEIYPKAIERQYRMWDVNINIPLPEGTSFVSADAPLPFVAGFNGNEISFSNVELERQVEVGPLTFQLAFTDTIDAQIWASWKNGPKDSLPRNGPAIIYPNTDVEDPLPPAEELIMLDVSVKQPQVPQQVVFDITGDVPFKNYDLSSIAFQEIGPILNIMFNITGDIRSVEHHPLQYTLLIDRDCNRNTGQQEKSRGVEYRLSYRHETNRTEIVSWDAEQQDWDWAQGTQLNTLVDKNTVTIALPYYLIETGDRFCWVGSSVNNAQGFYPPPPRDWVTNEEFLKTTQYEVVNAAKNIEGPGGKLAIPLNNSLGRYDVYIFSLLDGQELIQIPNARQPNFRFDGQKLLVNYEFNDAERVFEHDFTDGRKVTYVFKNFSSNENIYEYSLANATEKQVSDGRQDSYPFYDPQGKRVVYGNSKPSEDDNLQSSYIVEQCSLLPPRYEADSRCQSPTKSGGVEAAGQAEDLQGDYPVWANNDMIVYKGCSNSSASIACGIYMVNSRSTGLTNPIQLTQEATDIPSDAKHNFIAFTSRRNGNWEAYIMNLDGTGIRNLSNSPNSNDGLPTISPSGEWVAFVSDRNGHWAVWIVPVTGGPVQKLFNLPDDTPWGTGDREWIKERISWGP